ncbi:hypothetical protein KCP77_19075 [Salmonella enterica subsp. enterica]|nr:hypothetical protein KCP77_19075 [Salmonella enterica subsp. enterica]
MMTTRAAARYPPVVSLQINSSVEKQFGGPFAPPSRCFLYDVRGAYSGR